MLTSAANALATELTTAEEMAAGNLVGPIDMYCQRCVHLTWPVKQCWLLPAQATCQSVLHLTPRLRVGRACRVSSWYPACFLTTSAPHLHNFAWI